MVNITEKDGIYTLESPDFSLKIDNNRRVYTKKKTESSYSGTGTELEAGKYGPEEKKKYLYNLYLALMERKSEIDGNNKTSKEQKFI